MNNQPEIPAPAPPDTEPGEASAASSCSLLASKSWVLVDWTDCNVCGECPVEAKDADEDQKVWDGAEFRCPDCGAPGFASVDEGSCYVNWEGWDY